MNKGYPRTRFEIVDQSGQQEVSTAVTAESMPLAMATYTSDKGSEDWKIYTTLDSFLKDTGSISFAKHGQPQLTVAELLRNGAAVFCKRLVSNNASLANSTVYARIVRIAHKNEVAEYPYECLLCGILCVGVRHHHSAYVPIYRLLVALHQQSETLFGIAAHYLYYVIVADFHYL